MKLSYCINHCIKLSALSLAIFGGTLQPVFANFVSDSTLDLQLRNELRNASRPSADQPYGPEIHAWVQGFLFDFSSGKINDRISVDAALYHVEKLDADKNKATRFYLDGHDSYTLAAANVNLEFADWSQVRLGRFGVDSLYGTLEETVPLIDESSNRTEPTMAEGALWRGSFNNLNLYGMYMTKRAGRYLKSWTNTGLNGIVNGELKVVEKKPIYNLAVVWDNKQSNARLGLQSQDQHSNQLMLENGHTWVTPSGNFMKADTRVFYAKTKGASRALSESYNGKDSTYVVSGQMFWIKDKLTLMGAAGQAGSKLNALLDIDTDLGYVFDLSIDRTGHDMFSWQLASFYQLTPDLNAGIAVTVTDGYEDHTKQVEQKGLGGTLILMHEINSGQLKGLQTSFMYSRAEEDRKGSKRGDKLKYRDLKFTIHYPMNLF